MAEHLGPEYYTRLIGIESDEKLLVVNPRLAAASVE
jgi:hypothetical protein